MAEALRSLGEFLERAVVARPRERARLLPAARALDRALRELRTDVQRAGWTPALRPTRELANLYFAFAAVFFHARALVAADWLAGADDRTTAVGARLAGNARARADALVGRAGPRLVAVAPAIAAARRELSPDALRRRGADGPLAALAWLERLDEALQVLADVVATAGLAAPGDPRERAIDAPPRGDPRRHVRGARRRPPEPRTAAIARPSEWRRANSPARASRGRETLPAMREWFYRASNAGPDAARTRIFADDFGFICRSAFADAEHVQMIANVAKVDFGDVIHLYHVDDQGGSSLGAFRVVGPHRHPRGELFGAAVPKTKLRTVAEGPLREALSRPDSGYAVDPRLREYCGWPVIREDRHSPSYTRDLFVGRNTLVPR